MYDIDPDIQYHQASSIFSNTTCNYYLEDDFNRECIQRNVNNDCFSILHVNAQSLAKNFDSLKHYLSTLNCRFKIIAISESWLKMNNCDLYCPEGYVHVSNVRSAKRGGGVSTHTDHAPPAHCTRRDMSPGNLAKFKDKLAHFNWSAVYSNQDPRCAFDLFYKNYLDL